MELEKQEIGLLKGYEATICLKENCHPRYIQARRLTIHILSQSLKMIQQGNLEKVTHGEND